jgi:hypothetical protein
MTLGTMKIGTMTIINKTTYLLIEQWSLIGQIPNHWHSTHIHDCILLTTKLVEILSFFDFTSIHIFSFFRFCLKMINEFPSLSLKYL